MIVPPSGTPVGGTRRVLHFVTGGFSGATQVAVELCLSQLKAGRLQPVLALRRKRSTDPAKVQALRDQGLEVHLVPGWAHWMTVWSLRRLCQRLKPDVMVAHGFPEHLLGRRAALQAAVPAVVQVEHNSRERYNAGSLAQARALAPRSAKLVGVSEGVRQRLVALGMPEERTLAIPNGIRLERFAAADERPHSQRDAGIVMSARFARQKDQPTLIRAVALLGQRGLRPPVYLAGGGKASYRKTAERLVRELGLTGQVQFLGYHRDVPGLLMSQRIFVLSTHWEGMPLALLEGMAAGCACVASLVPGVEGVLVPERTGLLTPEGDAVALADALERLLRDEVLAQRLGTAARQRAIEEHSVELMTRRYEDLLLAV
ncbi:Glycosyltransferase involved in cell wall bisynthesis [Roseateles sp. YR242]|uniref:glycosyltransferase n=1 Tax=Roseateles sp. YR242 TaxID=1855305 RepID=UPI0008B6CBDC|nr:glycosyltransferase [Roseateles sp. YR242]SEL42757.1 Glycosyltransferase involved in cell wall bisynthesis [Roseateles sp. YR242]